MSNTWNEKYNSLQKTPIWKSKNVGSTVEMVRSNKKTTFGLAKYDEVDKKIWLIIHSFLISEC